MPTVFTRTFSAKKRLSLTSSSQATRLLPTRRVTPSTPSRPIRQRGLLQSAGQKRSRWSRNSHLRQPKISSTAPRYAVRRYFATSATQKQTAFVRFYWSRTWRILPLLFQTNLISWKISTQFLTRTSSISLENQGLRLVSVRACSSQKPAYEKAPLLV